jgi:uncharacterized protein
MSRPKRCRFITRFPDVTYFKPCGIPASYLQEISINFDEIEAIRLADLEGKYHEEGAKEMGISRPTFSRIIECARHKIADALINGKAIKIEGGNIALQMFKISCQCGSIRLLKSKDEIKLCPVCKSGNITVEGIKDINSLPEGPCNLWQSKEEQI